MKLRVSVPGLEKLADYTASGIGSVAGTMLLPWRARQEVKARLISAQGEMEAERILTEGRAATMHIIADAQAKARATLVSPDSNVKGELDFTDTVAQRIQFQEEKRQRNIESVVRQAASELGDKDVKDHEPDHDWTARFFNDIQDVSTEDAQLLYAKIIAGEVERPGSTSIKALSILRDLDQPTAKLFRVLRSASIFFFNVQDRMADARVISLGGNAGQNSLRDFGLSFGNLNVLNEHGLIISDYNSRYDITMCIGISFPIDKPPNSVVRCPFIFENRYWILEPNEPRPSDAEHRVSGVALTKAGRQLARLVECRPVRGYRQRLEAFFTSQKMVMAEVDSGLPQTIDTDAV